MNLQLAPTSFIVWIRKRREKTLNCMVLFIFTKDTKVKSKASINSMKLILRILLLRLSIKF